MIVHRMEESEKKASQTRKLIASINISPGGWADVLRCWCLYLRWMARTMDIPNCYSFIKLRPIVSPVISPAYEEDLKGIDAEAGDISPDYFPFLSSSILLNRTTIETPKADSSMSRKARSENQINRVYYVIVFHPRTFLFKRSRFRWKLFFHSFFFFFYFVLPPNRLSPTIHRLSYWFSFCAHNSEGNLHKSVITYTNPEPSIKFGTSSFGYKYAWTSSGGWRFYRSYSPLTVDCLCTQRRIVKIVIFIIHSELPEQTLARWKLWT